MDAVKNGGPREDSTRIGHFACLVGVPASLREKSTTICKTNLADSQCLETIFVKDFGIHSQGRTRTGAAEKWTHSFAGKVPFSVERNYGVCSVEMLPWFSEVCLVFCVIPVAKARGAQVRPALCAARPLTCRRSAASLSEGSSG